MAADDRDMNRDPITDEPGAHPVGTGVGATGGALAGAAAGTFAGPVGTMVGGVIGAVVGGLAGKAAPESVNPTAEEAHWRDTYTREPYYEQGRSFDDYRPAYLHGMTARMQDDTDWDDAEPRLASEWENQRAGSGLSWEQARPASRAAWDRIGARQGGSGARASDTAVVRANDLAPVAFTGGTDMAGSSVGIDQDVDGRSSDPDLGTTGMESPAAIAEIRRGDRLAGSPASTAQDTSIPGFAGTVQAGGNTGGDRDDVVDVLQDLVECCKDGEYGFRTSAEQARRADIRSVLQQRADDCRRGADQLNEHIRRLGGSAEDGGSAMGAMHRGWVSVKATLSTYDDKAVLEECERGEDNAKARYRKALDKPLPQDVKATVEKQYQGVQRNHDQVRQLRNQLRAEGDRGAGTAHDTAARVAAGTGSVGGVAMSGAQPGMQSQSQSQWQTGSGQGSGVAGSIGAAQSAGNTGGDRSDVVDALQDLVECCKDGEYGFRESAEQVKRQDLKSLFLQRADDCRRGADELNGHIRRLGGSVEDSGSALGALHRGWVSVKTTLSTHDDKAVLEECERGEDNALARYRKAMQKPLPADVKSTVERQCQAVQRNHDQIKMLRDSTQRG